MNDTPSAFLSYVRLDNPGAYLEQFCKDLSREVKIQTGKAFDVFMDAKLRAGDDWSQQLAQALERATFLIPIITPNYLKSDRCRNEVKYFLQKEKRLGRRGLIIPIHYVDSSQFLSPTSPAMDSVIEALASRQYVDWRSLRFVSLDSNQARRALAQIASSIRDVLLTYYAESQFPLDEHWKIEKLALKNFRCFDDLEISFRHQSMLEGNWSCVAGINGAGKTSILQAICIGLLSEHAQELGAGLLSRMRRTEAPTAPRTEIDISLVESGSEVERILSLQIDDKGIPRTRSTWSIESSILVVAYGATRNLSSEQDTSLRRLSPEAQRMSSLFFPLAQLASADVLISDRRRSDLLVPLFGSLIDGLFGGELALARQSGTMQFEVLGKDHIEALDLPDGFRSSAAWLADLCAAWCDKQPEKAKSANPKDIEAIVLIDEIDLHLHPSLQRELVPRLRKALPKVQWIVTTHSPLVLANFDVNEIIALDRDQAGNVRQLDRQILGFTSDQIYEWLMGTRPTGAAMEEEIEKADKGQGRSKKEIAEMLRVSPETDGRAAKTQVAEFREILKTLKSRS